MHLNRYKNKNILITGHTGFKGSWLTIWLQLLGANVIGYALDPKTSRDNFVQCHLQNTIIDYRADIRNKEKVFKVVKEEKPEIIFHLAAQPLVIESYKNPLETFEINIQGTVNMLESFRLSETATLLIVITSDKVYENREWEWGYRENDRLGGKDPYSASKSAVEIIARAYNESFFPNTGKRVLTVRAGNIFGGGDWSENRIVPDCIKALENNKPIFVRNPNAVRPWQYVLEPLGGYLLLGEKVLRNEVLSDISWNFGPRQQDNITVETLVQKVIAIYGCGTYEIKVNLGAFKESNHLSLDISKASNKLNWEPVFSFENAVQECVEWYKNYRDVNVREFCEEQIKKYEKKMEIKELKLSGVYEVLLKPTRDIRGYFLRTYDELIFKSAGLRFNWVQENHSRTVNKNTIRGLHFQLQPFCETKYIRCIRGAIYDVFVDLRRYSDTFARWESIELSEDNFKSILIPRGFAHGFCALTDECEVIYKVDNFYNVNYECGIIWNDPDININWPVVSPIVSEKDRSNMTLREFTLKNESISA